MISFTGQNVKVESKKFPGHLDHLSALPFYTAEQLNVNSRMQKKNHLTGNIEGIYKI
jgi:hypothetical protein